MKERVVRVKIKKYLRNIDSRSNSTKMGQRKNKKKKKIKNETTH